MEHLSKLRRALDPPAPAASAKHEYLTGLRGLLTIQTVLWLFLSVFVPAAVKTADPERQSDGPQYAVVLRKTLGPIFWNSALIYSSYILLSARVICIPFLQSHSKLEVASTVFKRCVRLLLPTAVALGIAWGGLYSSGSTITAFCEQTGNTNIRVPTIPAHAGVYFNSVFNLFWITKDYYSQAANFAFPSATLWTISLVYEQSYTIFMIMVIVPYTLTAWRMKSLAVFVAAAWWVGSWSWYSVTGFILADASIHTDLAARARQGLTFRVLFSKKTASVPVYPVFAAIVLAGLIMQYIYAAWRPELSNAELDGHSGLYNYTPKTGVDLNQPQARLDNYLIILGAFLMLETYPTLQSILALPPFTFLGRRSLSYFLTSPTLLYSLGIRLFMYLRFSKGWSQEATVGLVGLGAVPIILVAAEVFHWVIDCPSRFVARRLWVWITE